MILLTIYFSRNIPKIEFAVDKVEKVPSFWNKKDSVITLTLSTKEDFIKMYKDKQAVNIYMLCPLTTNDFSEKKTGSELFLIKSLKFRHDTTVKRGDRFTYKFPIVFINKDYNEMNKITALALLKKRNCVDCTIIMAFLAPIVLNQESKKFCVPSDSLIKLLE
jgi:hypothetical protein